MDITNKLTKLEEIQAAEARLLIPHYDRIPILFVAARAFI